MGQNGRIEILFELVQQMRAETNRRFDRLEDSLMRRLDNHDDRISKLEERQAGLESTVGATQSYGKRINELEKQHAHLQGKVAAWSGFISAIVSFISRLIPWGGGQQ